MPATPAPRARVLALVAVLATLLLGAPGSATAAARGQTTGEVRYSDTAHAATVLARKRHDVAGLEQSDCLAHFARREARRIAGLGQLDHQELGPVLRGCGLHTAGENIAVGYPSGKAVVRVGWMRSEGHRENILNPAFTAEGIGAVKVHGRWWVSQVFGG